jgi:type IV secretion system protein VirD4
MYLGNLVDNGGLGSVIGFNGDGHMLTVGPPRSGKSRRLLIPNLLFETGRSMLVIDMKGELCATTAAHRTASGGQVVALDPFGSLAARGGNVRTVGFNPMAALDPESETFVDEAMVLAEALVQVKPNDQNAYFSEGAQDLVAGMIMLVRCINGAAAHLGQVRRELTKPFSEIELIAKKATGMESLPAPVRNKLSRFSDIKESKEMPAVISTAQVQTRFLDSPPIVRNLSVNEIDFRVLKQRNITVFLCLPPDKLVTHAKWLRLIVGAAMTAMQQPVAGSDQRPSVLFMLDEFPQLGRMPSIETAIALNAGYGVKVWPAVQSLTQLAEIYGASWELFVAGGCLTTFGPRDVFTRDYLTKLVGTGGRAMESMSINPDGTVSRSRSVQKDDIMAAWQWDSMILGEQQIFMPTDQGRKRLHVYAPDYTQLGDVKNGKIRPGSW